MWLRLLLLLLPPPRRPNSHGIRTLQRRGDGQGTSFTGSLGRRFRAKP